MNRRDFFKKIGIGLVGVAGVALIGKPKEELPPLRVVTFPSQQQVKPIKYPPSHDELVDVFNKIMSKPENRKSVVIPIDGNRHNFSTGKEVDLIQKLSAQETDMESISTQYNGMKFGYSFDSVVWEDKPINVVWE